ncbi:hypothetical protein M406DRAFT_233854, partial [Cryphonectria parasitica EP155]
GTLPTELRRNVARYLVPEYAVARLSTLNDQVDLNSFMAFAPSGEVWAGNIRYEGVRYISSLSNRRISIEDRLVYRPVPGQLIDTVYTCLNHLGVVQVVFGQSRHPP